MVRKLKKNVCWEKHVSLQTFEKRNIRHIKGNKELPVSLAFLYDKWHNHIFTETWPKYTFKSTLDCFEFVNNLKHNYTVFFV